MDAIFSFRLGERDKRNHPSFWLNEHFAATLE